MGQVALGIRSLLIKAAVFFVLCALLVWTLGGQLFPRPEVVNGPSVEFAGSRWFWQLSAGGEEPGAMHWSLMEMVDDKPIPVNDKRWADIAGPVVADDAMYYAGRPDHHAQVDWIMNRMVVGDSSMTTTSWTYPDRLAVEQQLERLRHGLPLQDVATVRAQRPAILEPQPVSADEDPSPSRDELTERSPGESGS